MRLYLHNRLFWRPKMSRGPIERSTLPPNLRPSLRGEMSTKDVIAALSEYKTKIGDMFPDDENKYDQLLNEALRTNEMRRLIANIVSNHPINKLIKADHEDLAIRRNYIQLITSLYPVRDTRPPELAFTVHYLTTNEKDIDAASFMPDTTFMQHIDIIRRFNDNFLNQTKYKAEADDIYQRIVDKTDWDLGRLGVTTHITNALGNDEEKALPKTASRIIMRINDEREKIIDQQDWKSVSKDVEAILSRSEEPTLYSKLRGRSDDTQKFYKDMMAEIRAISTDIQTNAPRR